MGAKLSDVAGSTRPEEAVHGTVFQISNSICNRLISARERAPSAAAYTARPGAPSTASGARSPWTVFQISNSICNRLISGTKFPDGRIHNALHGALFPWGPPRTVAFAGLSGEVPFYLACATSTGHVATRRPIHSEVSAYLVHHRAHLSRPTAGPPWTRSFARRDSPLARLAGSLVCEIGKLEHRPQGRAALSAQCTTTRSRPANLRFGDRVSTAALQDSEIFA